MNNIKALLLNMEASNRSNPYFADLNAGNLPPAPPVIPPRPKAPARIRNPPRRVDALWDLMAYVKENHEPSAKKESR